MDELQAIRERYRRASGDLLTRDAAWLMNEIDTLRAEIEAKDAELEMRKLQADYLRDEARNRLEAKDEELADANGQVDLYKQRIQQLHASHERKDLEK